MKINFGDSQRMTNSEKESRAMNKVGMPMRFDQVFADNIGYNIYPTASLDQGKIFSGFSSLAQYIGVKRTVIIDGYLGLFWETIKLALDDHFSEAGLIVNWIKTNDFLKNIADIDLLVSPFLGEQNSVWGTKTTLILSDFYTSEISQQIVNENVDINIIIGTGAALSAWEVPIIYFDLPKNELQLRMRAGSITNLGTDKSTNNKTMYKRFYFVDWVVLNDYKKSILDKVSVFADGQWEQDVNWIKADDLMTGLEKLSKTFFRVRPWFEPGAWGGQWMKDQIHGLDKEAVNYAWSFEMIVPENGLVFESGGYLLEVSFDMLMFAQGKSVLGKHSERFGDEFPIRFDFLDTWKGGALSVQCHPSVSYIQQQFGEKLTQDETYYILDADENENANVYLGFQEDIDIQEFRSALEESRDNGKKIEITKYVQSLPAKKHDFFLIPNGTIHSSGPGNMVLEISATPYIFTFKIYDWLRLGLDGKPRPINIEHAFNNLNFDRKGKQVQEELVSKPTVIDEADGYQLIHLPTHAEHFYDVHRIEFDHKAVVDTNNVCHVLMLVEGESIILEITGGARHVFAYAETFVVPAAAGSYTLTNVSEGSAKVIKAFLK